MQGTNNMDFSCLRVRENVHHAQDCTRCIFLNHVDALIAVDAAAAKNGEIKLFLIRLQHRMAEWNGKIPA